MKILQVTPTFVPSKFGGVKMVSYNLSRVLAKRGHKVTVYTTDVDAGHSRLRGVQDIRNLDGFNVKYFKNVSNLLAFKHRLFLPKGVVSAVKKEIGDFDIIHLHDFRGFQSIVIHHYAQKYGIPYILQAHGSLVTFYQKGILKRVFDAIWGHRILNDAAKLIAVTPMEAEQYKSMGISEDKIEIVPNGIDLSEFENLPPRGEFRKKWGINDNQKMILYLGRIHKVKGLDLLAEAFAGLSKELDNARLVVVGPDDGYLRALEELIQELKIEGKVVFTGPLYGTDKLGAYVDADVFVNLRADEIFGIVFLEACACGTPVICSTGCGLADIIDGQVGIAVPYDRDQLSSAILRMLNDDKMRREFSEKGKLLVRGRFSWEKIAEQIENVYEGIIQI